MFWKTCQLSGPSTLKYAFCCLRIWQILPDIFGHVWKYRCNSLCKSFKKRMNDSLTTSSTIVVDRRYVQAVLCNIEIEIGHVGCGESQKFLDRSLELVHIHSLVNFFQHCT
mmetsp:Transcript_91704/g.263927  ORF Transcript_91704/g.263927 Transcript_91704/m.263927 type:complete len:111 (+) Transcript_91704:510-842(+)